MNATALTKQEFQHLANKINNNVISCEYFRKNLFNTSFRGSKELKRKKTIYKDNKIEIKVNRSLNQKHRDLFSLLAHEEKSKLANDGRYYIKTSLYSLAVKMRYKNACASVKDVKKLLNDMSLTRFYTNNARGGGVEHNLLGEIYRDRNEDCFMIEVPPSSAKYMIYTTGVSIPQKINDKIVAIENSKSRLKALVSFILSNRTLVNGMYFDTMCKKLGILEKTAKSKFKKQVNDNIEMLKKDFKILFRDDKFYLKKEKCTFYPALSQKQILSFEKSEQQKMYDKKFNDVMKYKKDDNKVIFSFLTKNNENVTVKFKNERLSFFLEDEFNKNLNDDETRNLILNLVKNDTIQKK